VTQLGQQAVEGLCEQINRYDPKGGLFARRGGLRYSKMDEWHQLFNGVGAGRRIAPPLIGIIRRGAKEDVLAPQR
jgi:hypothetical protein